MREKEDLTHLGSQGTKYPTDYAPEMLERFSNKPAVNITDDIRQVFPFHSSKPSSLR